MTDNELIEGIIQHDRNAIRTLVGNYKNKVIKTAFYFTHNMEDAEELSQDIFMEIIGSIKRFRKTSSLSTWIYRMTVNKSLNHLKKNRRQKLFSSVEDFFHKRSTSAERIPDELSTTTTRLEDRERRELLNRSILSLPDNQRIAFTLSKYEGLSYQEIAEIMNLSISSIESLLHRAKLNLQKRLAYQFSEYINK